MTGYWRNAGRKFPERGPKFPCAVATQNHSRIRRKNDEMQLTTNMSCFTLRAMVHAGGCELVTCIAELAMVDGPEVLLLVSAVLLLLVLVPRALTERYCATFRSLTTGLPAALQCLLAVLVAVAGIVTGGEKATFIILGSLSFVSDGTSMLMFMLVSFIGWITCQYSIRYLDGESNRGATFNGWLSRWAR